MKVFTQCILDCVQLSDKGIRIFLKVARRPINDLDTMVCLNEYCPASFESKLLRGCSLVFRQAPFYGVYRWVLASCSYGECLAGFHPHPSISYLAPKESFCDPCIRWIKTKQAHQGHSLGRGDTPALGVNGVIGSGIFFLPSVGHKLLGPAAILSTLLAGVLAWMIGVSAFGAVAKGYEKMAGPTYTRDHFGTGRASLLAGQTWLVAVTSWGVLLNALGLEGLSHSAIAEPGVKQLGMTVLVLLSYWLTFEV